ncbi:hypothetical protein NC652_002536 [Populus alba x Populus x berolinensis]|uniref:Uncharacterized protein n=1 Tax=Populus alba x Populus x berolinensis TaxID=444605 RepID=A0AAD6RPB5_9ROSI|nr:hypothetical protein NC652_002536 [Populus alba x Populus x berolinensis]KAJ7012603.1 hypothetical protein NC653_002606 [Populus alba x Populus x berolinensis]
MVGPKALASLILSSGAVSKRYNQKDNIESTPVTGRPGNLSGVL